MNSKFQNQPDFKQIQQVQSFHEPALRLLNQLYARNQENLRSKGYDENNAAITKNVLSEVMARQFRITQWLASQIVSSLIHSGLVDSFGGYVKPKVGGV
ncbi:hypothetical protein [Acinetobacter ursingii]|uniref:hypothetical protein n=1 Tax=Acinetobacter ursingii TaxID=108980 RepID=UPI00029A9DA4|nr:hypothetical protein [Acinetobacter ursingii]ENV76224.1 hypothetical protein F944_01695 [Acinetobacter ursingii DSM 16037 = CIP 107286]QQT67268.1 hypothetical protein I6I52_06460 [Acinetobacter ursingii]